MQNQYPQHGERILGSGDSPRRHNIQLFVLVFAIVSVAGSYLSVWQYAVHGLVGGNSLYYILPTMILFHLVLAVTGIVWLTRGIIRRNRVTAAAGSFLIILCVVPYICPLFSYHDVFVASRSWFLIHTPWDDVLRDCRQVIKDARPSFPPSTGTAVDSQYPDIRKYPTLAQLHPRCIIADSDRVTLIFSREESWEYYEKFPGEWVLMDNCFNKKLATYSE